MNIIHSEWSKRMPYKANTLKLPIRNTVFSYRGINYHPLYLSERLAGEEADDELGNPVEQLDLAGVQDAGPAVLGRVRHHLPVPNVIIYMCAVVVHRRVKLPKR